MKKFLLIALAVLSINSFANPKTHIYGVVTDAFCGEMDPFVVGDVCIVYVKTARANLAFVHPDYDLGYEYEDLESWAGKRVAVSKAGLSNIYDREALRELQSFQRAFYLNNDLLDSYTLLD